MSCRQHRACKHGVMVTAGVVSYCKLSIIVVILRCHDASLVNL